MQPATGKEDNGINITQSAPQEQTVKDNLTSADRAYKSNSSGKLVNICEFFPMLKC